VLAAADGEEGCSLNKLAADNTRLLPAAPCTAPLGRPCNHERFCLCVVGVKWSGYTARSDSSSIGCQLFRTATLQQRLRLRVCDAYAHSIVQRLLLY
jgi:hypothetical protein